MLQYLFDNQQISLWCLNVELCQSERRPHEMQPPLFLTTCSEDLGQNILIQIDQIHNLIQLVMLKCYTEHKSELVVKNVRCLQTHVTRGNTIAMLKHVPQYHGNLRWLSWIVLRRPKTLRFNKKSALWAPYKAFRPRSFVNQKAAVQTTSRPDCGHITKISLVCVVSAVQF